MLVTFQPVIAIVLIQALIVGSYGLRGLFYGIDESGLWSAELNVFLSCLLVYMYIGISHKDDIILTQRSHIESVGTLTKTILSQKHDFLNHLTALYGLLQMGKFNEARQYAGDMCSEAHDAGQLASLKQPDIAAFILRKRIQLLKQGVIFHLEIKTDLIELRRIRPFELNKILGNLIDSSLEALQEKEGHKEITLVIDEDEQNNYNITASDNGPGFKAAIINKIFEPGFSTRGESRGFGLAIVQETVATLNGNILVTENPVTFKINIPKDLR